MNLKLPLMVIACAGAGILLSFGLCGANAMLRSHDNQRVLAGVGLILFALSVLTIIGGCCWLVVAAIINAVRR